MRRHCRRTARCAAVLARPGGSPALARATLWIGMLYGTRPLDAPSSCHPACSRHNCCLSPTHTTVIPRMSFACRTRLSLPHALLPRPVCSPVRHSPAVLLRLASTSPSAPPPRHREDDTKQTSKPDVRAPPPPRQPISAPNPIAFALIALAAFGAFAFTVRQRAEDPDKARREQRIPHPDPLKPVRNPTVS